METRASGNSGIRAGAVGLGCEGLRDKARACYVRALDLMEATGANCIDLYSPSPVLRSNLGEAVKRRREMFVLHVQLGKSAGERHPHRHGHQAA